MKKSFIIALVAMSTTSMWAQQMSVHVSEEDKTIETVMVDNSNKTQKENETPKSTNMETVSNNTSVEAPHSASKEEQDKQELMKQLIAVQEKQTKQLSTMKWIMIGYGALTFLSCVLAFTKK